MSPNEAIKLERVPSVVWDKASVEDLQHYASLVDMKLKELSNPDNVLHCTGPLCQDTNLFWTLIVKQSVTVRFNLPNTVFQLQVLVSRLLGGMLSHAC